MYTTILFKAPGRRSNSPVVNLNAPSRRRSLTLGSGLSRALSMAWRWVKCNCTPRNIVRVAFGTNVSAIVAIVGISAMWWHNASIAGTIEAQNAVANDFLCMMPWGIAWAIRESRASQPKEGGEE